jgi:hypothetical protein
LENPGRPRGRNRPYVDEKADPCFLEYVEDRGSGGVLIANGEQMAVHFVAILAEPLPSPHVVFTAMLQPQGAVVKRPRISG